MQKFAISFLCFSLTLLLAGCGPIYHTEYAYVPPASNIGKMCTTQCLQSKNSCEQMCQMRNDNCRMQARQDAMYQFEIYRGERERQHKPIKKSVSDFDRSIFTCHESCGCEANYRVCYAQCGGAVLERRVCTAFCDKK